MRLALSEREAAGRSADPAKSQPIVKYTVEAVGWRAFERGTLRGFVDVHLRELGLTIFGCTVHESHGHRWVALPGKPLLDDHRQLVTDRGGKVRYVPVAGFADRRLGDAFSRLALDALARLRRNEHGP